MKFLTRFRTDESGATAIEYGLIVALICLATIAGFNALGTGNSNVITSAMNRIVAALRG